MGIAEYYRVLEITEQASPDEVRAAYRRRARECHPDMNPCDASSADRFKMLNEAYEAIKAAESNSSCRKGKEVPIKYGPGPSRPVRYTARRVPDCAEDLLDYEINRVHTLLREIDQEMNRNSSLISRLLSRYWY